MKGFKTVVLMIVIFVLSWMIYIKLTTKPETYVCNDGTQHMMVTLEHNYPWVSLYSKVHGTINLQTSVEEQIRYEYTTLNNILKFFDSHKVVGEYTLVDKRLVLKSNKLSFEGSCSVCKEHCANNIMH